MRPRDSGERACPMGRRPPQPRNPGGVRHSEWAIVRHPERGLDRARLPGRFSAAGGTDSAPRRRPWRPLLPLHRPRWLRLHLRVESESIVRELQPDFKLLKEAGPRGVIVTARADSEEFDFVSRFFAPAYGVDEDPVTGSAHCCLGPYWASRLGKTDLVGYQASARGGVVRVGVRGDRVLLGGQAITVLRGQLLDS